MATDGGDVNAELIAFFRQRLEKLLAMINPHAGLVLVHHTNKISGKTLNEDPMTAISGGGAMLSYPSALTVLSKAENEEGQGITCWFDLRYGPHIPVRTFIRKDDGWCEAGQHDIRLVRQRWGEMNDKEQARKRVSILVFIYEEARKGALYNIDALCNTLAGTKGLGSTGTIRTLLRQYQTKGYIRFISNERAAVEYGLSKTSSPHGYLCVEGMRHDEYVCAETGEIKPGFPYIPTHYRCPRSNEVFELRKEDIGQWHYIDDDGKEENA